MKIGFVGSGSMASALARGWASAEGFDAELAFSDRGSGRAADLAAELGGVAASGNAELAERSELIVLAVKPAQLEEVAAEIAPPGTPVVSLLGATSLATLGEALPGVAVGRVMPNVGVEVRQGVLCYALSDELKAAHGDWLTGALDLLGLALEIDDDQIDAATAVMSCSPAYVALLCETLIEAAAREGVAEADAERIVVETIVGTAELLRDRDPEAIRRAVASRGGSTEAGLEALEQGGFQRALADAVDASLEKMRR